MHLILGTHDCKSSYFNGRKRVIRIRIDNLTQAPEELSNPRRVVAAEQEDSPWRSMLAYVHVFRFSIYAATKHGGSIMNSSLDL
jgi:hypothetical protein